MYEFVELQRSRRRPLRAQSRSLGGCERSLAAVDVLAAVSCIDPQTAFHRFVFFRAWCLCRGAASGGNYLAAGGQANGQCMVCAFTAPCRVHTTRRRSTRRRSYSSSHGPQHYSRRSYSSSHWRRARRPYERSGQLRPTGVRCSLHLQVKTCRRGPRQSSSPPGT